MHTHTPDLSTRAQAAVEFALDAGAAVFHAFRSPESLGDELKADGTVVTHADRAAEQRLRELIRARFPSDAIVGEEFGELPGDSGYCWVLDPIDGTRSFASRVPMYGCMIAVEHHGRPIAGVVHLPASHDTLFAEQGRGTWITGRDASGRTFTRRARCSTTAALADAIVTMTCPSVLASPDPLNPTLPHTLDRLALACKHLRGWGDCVGHVLVALGHADAMIDGHLAHWDAAPIEPIIAEAGGRLSRWRNGWISSNATLHDELLDLLR
jgi:histidinol phosphatase-like enzyme (inositol monophosphatase family)